MKMIQKVGAMALVAALFLASCAGGSNESAEQDTTTMVKAQKYSVEYPLPTPFEITRMLDEAGASYIFDMSNSSDNVGKYLTEKEQAVNLGIYGADLSYAATYNRTQETQIFMNCSRQLTESLGIAGVFEESIIKRIEANIENKDSLHLIISDTFYGTFDYLNNNSKGAISVMVLAGGYIEGIYIASQIYLIAGDTKNIIDGISAQKAVTEQLLSLMQTYSDNSSVAELIAELNKIKVVFDKTAGNAQLTDAQVKELAKVVESVRSKLI